ncbi:2-succinyl-5-enolpyruvyl-6-hydroxy-3-cyclohexene-1-carboxylic-acid synthase [Thioflavicoccus mobilis 8321]|uniref:2-succinyl-5-enolpyruvyl-6-hydroxy-3-cyclohexene-1-carboxylate synthase n=1 Tax=Thioflavicoccus mobilis 8321 TaxID=765912 RepID=L0H328_9GAMM|nr:2-succinyl-5-enolpyruvyl-6-hydroxy-3-cyclohexene-1-carboxylic-acid synthase [Thioflavicoccus mobilis]AGA91984.1 2-succinyl-5-enolpyruvyl-6-hydroxy-3-cyclohexene-1-carboxylic-acid synthase [Thioflavicoccus mobilis 8321]
MSTDTPTDQACINLRWSLTLLDGLIRGGMRDLVLSPGSRSTPMVLAATREPDLNLTVVVDERSAGFFALGLARATRRPVGLLCTSGSAPAHWLPAVIEASEWGVPLILLSADRPPELHGWGANQTIEQADLFAGFVRERHDPGPAVAVPAALKALRALGARVAAVAKGRRPGPVHINLPLREPLVPGPDCTATPATGEAPLPPLPKMDAGDPPIPQDLPGLLTGRGLICCGPGEHGQPIAEALHRCTAALALPVLVDPLSGLRFGPGPEPRIARYDSLLRNPATAAGLRPDWVIRLGRAPVSKTLNEWLTGVPSILIDPAERWCDPTHDARLQIGARPERFLAWLAESGLVVAAPDWLARWQAAEQRIAALAEAHLDAAPWGEAHLIRTLVAELPVGDALLCANSLPIRQLDTWSGTRATPLTVFSNRGASGIDGQASTLAGLNAAGVPTWGLLGDLSLCHDLSGLLLGRHFARPLLVINNGGGRIFDYLPQRALPELATYWRTPLPLDLGELAHTFGLPYRRVEDDAGLRQVLAAARSGDDRSLVEVRIDAACSQASQEAFWRRIAAPASP